MMGREGIGVIVKNEARHRSQASDGAEGSVGGECAYDNTKPTCVGSVDASTQSARRLKRSIRRMAS
jgi:hypothetical protein